MAQWVLNALGVSLGLTLALEEGFALLCGIRHKKDLLLVCLVNIMTNPAVVLCYHLAGIYTSWSPVLVIAILEVSAFVVEGLYYKAYAVSIGHPFRFSALANAFSFGIGLVINRLFQMT